MTMAWQVQNSRTRKPREGEGEGRELFEELISLYLQTCRAAEYLVSADKEADNFLVLVLLRVLRRDRCVKRDNEYLPEMKSSS